jgi:hypothetical protein
MSFCLTKYPGRVRVFDESMLISIKRRDKLIDYCQPLVKYENEASFNGVKICLRTNMEHVYDFWLENWFTACPDMRSHAEIYAIDDGGKIPVEDIFEKRVDKPDVNAGAVYNPETKTTIVMNSDYYGETKPTSLAMAADILEDRFGVLSVHGASAAIDGKGYLLIGPTNAGKTTHSYGPIFHHPKGEFHQDDWIFVRFSAGKAFGCASERKFYMRTNSIQNFPWLEQTFRTNKLENVPPDAPRESFFPGLPRVMVDPKHIVSPEKVVDEVRIYKTFILSRNPKEKMVIRSLEPEEAVEILSNAPEKWHNNYLTTFGPRKDARRAQLFKELFEIAEPYLVNTVASVENVRNIIIRVATS